MGFCKWLILRVPGSTLGSCSLFYLTFFTELFSLKQATACWTRRMIVFERLRLSNGWSRPAKRSAEPGKSNSLTGPSFFRPSPPKSVGFTCLNFPSNSRAGESGQRVDLWRPELWPWPSKIVSVSSARSEASGRLNYIDIVVRKGAKERLIDRVSDWVSEF